jgi:hypothetical protein
METKAMQTAKQLAFKAWCDGMKCIDPDYVNKYSIGEITNRFESWWREYYIRSEHKEGFNAKHFVMIDQKVYIQAD